MKLVVCATEPSIIKAREGQEVTEIASRNWTDKAVEAYGVRWSRVYPSDIVMIVEEE